MKTRHIYTIRNGTVLVLENICTVHPTNRAGTFRVYDTTTKHLDIPDTEFQLPKGGGSYYITTERAELIKALEAI